MEIGGKFEYEPPAVDNVPLLPFATQKRHTERPSNVNSAKRGHWESEWEKIYGKFPEPDWLEIEVKGELAEGACYERILMDVRRLGLDVNLDDYFGLYDKNCHCHACKLRRHDHQEELARKARVGAVMYVSDEEDDVSDMLLQHGLSAATVPEQTLRYSRTGRDWVSQRYAVKFGVMRDMIFRLQCGDPVVDAFADRSNHRCQRYWGNGGEAEDAYEVNWHGQGLIWCNPPFRDLFALPGKIWNDRAEVICAVPDWRDHDWLQELWCMSQRQYYYPEGRLIYELDGDAMPPTRWGVWALYINAEELPDRVEVPQTWKPTLGGQRRRRYRRNGKGQGN